MTRQPTDYDLENRLIDFAVSILEVVEEFSNTRAGNHIAGQVVRSGTSPAPNYAEAQSAESRRDFIHKLKIALKELRETRVWLLIAARKSLGVLPDTIKPVLSECDELIRIFATSVKTAEANRVKEGPTTESLNIEYPMSKAQVYVSYFDIRYWIFDIRNSRRSANGKSEY